MSTKIDQLKAALYDELISQVRDGITVTDKETGEVVKLSTPANVLAVAAKVVKDFHDEATPEDKTGQLKGLLANYAARQSTPTPVGNA